MPQVKFKVDYSGGRGKWRSFKNTCRRYDGPTLAWFVAGVQGERRLVLGAAELAADAAERRLRPVDARAEGLGAAHLTLDRRDSRSSRCTRTGSTAAASTRSSAARRTAAQPIYGFKTTRSGKPLDTYGRLIFLDTLNSAVRGGLEARELVRRAQPERDVLLRLLSVLARTGAIRRSARRSSPATARVPPDALRPGRHARRRDVTVDGLQAYDSKIPTRELGEQMREVRDGREYGEHVRPPSLSCTSVVRRRRARVSVGAPAHRRRGRLVRATDLERARAASKCKLSARCRA